MNKPPIISVTEFRANIYATIDRVLQSGKPLVVSRNGDLVEIRRKPKRKARAAGPSKKVKVVNDLSALKPGLRNCMKESPEWYISPKLDEWNPDNDLS